MTKKITVSTSVFEEFEKEVQRSLADKKRTRDDVSNKEVLLIIDNPGCEIEVIDPTTKKVVGTVAAGLGAAGFAAAAVGGGVVAGGAAVGGATVFSVAAAAAAVPGPGWIIAGGILVITTITSVGVAIACNADKKKAEENYNLKLKLLQECIKKLLDEIQHLKKENQEYSRRYNYLISILNAIQAQPV